MSDCKYYVFTTLSVVLFFVILTLLRVFQPTLERAAFLEGRHNLKPLAALRLAVLEGR